MNTKTADAMTAPVDLTVELRFADGSFAEFYEADEERIRKTLWMLTGPRLLTQPQLVFASGHDVKPTPSDGVDMILAHTDAHAPPIFPLIFPAGLLDLREVQENSWHHNENGSADPACLSPITSRIEIHTTGGWMVPLEVVAIASANRNQRQLFSRFLDLPAIAFRLDAGGIGLINPANVTRISAPRRVRHCLASHFLRNRFSQTCLDPQIQPASPRFSAMKTKIKLPSPRLEENKRSATSSVIRVFLADDQPIMVALMARILARDPRVIIVGSATDGRRAFQSAASSHPDLVLTDLHMPLADGAEVTRRLKRLPNPPIVFVVTSDDSPEALNRCLVAGADAFIVKAADLLIQLQTAMENFFPLDGEQQKQPSNQKYELVNATE
jgi:CheY-like chemotaxis protein